MRILMAACSLRRREGGASGVVMELARQLEGFGHEVDMAFREDLLGQETPPHRFDELQFASRLARRIFDEPDRYSVVNLRAPSGCVYGFQRRYGGKRNGPPYVMTLDGLEERRVYVQRAEAKKGAAWDFRLKNRLWHRLYHLPRFRMSIRTADWAICSNQEIWSYLQLVYGLDSRRVAYIPYGVDPRFFQKREYRNGTTPRLLYIGTWLEQRGTRYLAEAFAILAQKLPGIRLTVLGSLSPAEAVQNYFAAPLRQQVQVIPLVPAAQIPEVYLQHDIFVFPSFVEGLPLVLLEAMATGLPVVTTETCGMMDVVKNGWNGLLIPPGDANAIAAAVMQLSQSLELRIRLGQAAQQTMSAYTWEKIARQVEAVLQQSAGASRRSAS
jgi:glycosyltransferase involved in cell wall biosynthesis